MKALRALGFCLKESHATVRASFFFFLADRAAHSLLTRAYFVAVVAQKIVMELRNLNNDICTFNRFAALAYRHRNLPVPSRKDLAEAFQALDWWDSASASQLTGFFSFRNYSTPGLGQQGQERLAVERRTLALPSNVRERLWRRRT